MSLLVVTSPHAHGPMSTSSVMRTVLLATLPGVIALTYYFGFGIVVNIVFGGAVALLCESLALLLRKQPLKPFLTDYSALVTSTLLCIALPPYAPWWLLVIGVGFSILIAKHLYGGLGYNPFNPAMVGYVVLLISFPLQMSTWAAPLGVGESVPGLLAALNACFNPGSFDAQTMATPLDLMRQNKGMLLSDLYAANPQFGAFQGVGWAGANAAFLLGGLFLLSKRVFTWHAPLAMLLALSLCALVFYDEGSSASGGSPLFHLFSGATMFGAFFILTDPVSSAVSNRGRLIFGAMIGVLIYTIRVRGNYPDAVAFAVLIANFAAPFIDNYTQPKVYGQRGGPTA
ncbi:electron transport complex subunit RsxD [Congregibacter brevis]|uniref:Ion-translocating oxidoreductase complex subunit D n=1 Tax=Congregibacter brevis TaxID=3081201 RepID=A0ABZ0IDH2_9GAMM|nr:electron transport complex subunit RsxD [Congregibacter sp. IMCC45268]